MKEKEIELFKELCNFKKNKFEESLLEYATPNVLGQLFFNRMQTVAYYTLKKNGVLNKVNREFRNSLKVAYDQNLEKNNSFFRCVQLVSDILKKSKCKVAMLKGAFLCAHYPNGCRSSNDIDLLVLPKNVTEIGNLLLDAGFRQGSVRDDKFIPASRTEIIESKMMRGETVPYIKYVGLTGMKYLEVDINFSLDYKNGDTQLLSDILQETHIVELGQIKIPTLSKSDFLIHLCAHLYKEATSLPWIEMHRDMTLYKYCDIYMMLNEMSEQEILDFFMRTKLLGMEQVCAYAILETAGLFDIENKNIIKMAKKIFEIDPDFLLRVVSPKDKKTLIYKTRDFVKRLFNEDRITDLCEVIIDEKIKNA